MDPSYSEGGLRSGLSGFTPRGASTPISRREQDSWEGRALLESLARRAKKNIREYKKIMRQERRSKSELRSRITALEQLVHQM